MDFKHITFQQYLVLEAAMSSGNAEALKLDIAKNKKRLASKSKTNTERFSQLTNYLPKGPPREGNKN